MKVRLTTVTCLTAAVLFSAAPAHAADPLGWYRMGDDDGGTGSNTPTDGGGIAFNTNGTLNHISGAWPLLRGRPSSGTGVPTYSLNVPGAAIYDPIGDQTLANEWSLKSTSSDGSHMTRANTGFDSQFSFELFVYFDATNMAPFRGMEFVNHRNTSNGGFDMQIGTVGSGNPDKVRFRISTVNPSTQELIFYGTTAIQPKTWYHLGAVYSLNQDESHTAELYVDYALDNSGSVPAGQAFGTGDFQVIVGHVSGGIGSGGLRTIAVDEFRYFNEARSPGDFLRVPGVPGDYNGDDLVDAADYVVWRKNLDGPAESIRNRDSNNSGPINQSDYDFWRLNFGMGSSSGGGASTLASVPEPAGWLMFASAALVLSGTRARSVRLCHFWYRFAFCLCSSPLAPR